MNIAWASIRCPVYGQLRVNLGDLIEQKHEPWRTHALYCLTNEFITASETLVIIGIGKNSDIVAMAWLSLPEKFLVSFGKTWAYIYHVYVAPAWRHHGLGTQAVQFACTTAMHCGFYQVLLSATDEELRKRFYGALGFRPVPDDPWLMSWNIEEPSHVAAIPTNILLKRQLIRSISQHDLATVQSICAQSHWLCTLEDAKPEKPTECEEEFCTWIGMGGNQFIIYGQYGGEDFVAWFRQVKDNNKWLQQIICQCILDTEVHQLAIQIAEVVALVGQYPNNELQNFPLSLLSFE